LKNRWPLSTMENNPSNGTASPASPVTPLGQNGTPTSLDTNGLAGLTLGANDKNLNSEGAASPVSPSSGSSETPTSSDTKGLDTGAQTIEKEAQKNVSILSLDGGGARGIMESITLGHLMSLATLMAEKPSETQKALEVVNQYQNLIETIESKVKTEKNLAKDKRKEIKVAFMKEKNKTILKILGNFKELPNATQRMVEIANCCIVRLGSCEETNLN